jgi:hypothetical protein
MIAMAEAGERATMMEAPVAARAPRHGEDRAFMNASRGVDDSA